MNYFRWFLVLTLTTVSLQATRPAPVPDLDLFLQPLQMTATGVHIFFEQLYNSRRYTEDFFPNNFSHLIQFLEHGKATAQDRAYTKATLSLFSQKIKGCVYVSAYAFDDLLNALPHLIDYHFSGHTKDADQKKKAIKHILYEEFLNNFAAFKDNPASFFDHLSDTILQTVDPDAMQGINIEYLRQTIVRFVELGLSKVLWDPTDRNVWKSAKRMGENITRLHEMHIISDADDLNDLYWSLIHRLCYFIDVAGSDVPLEVYEEIRQDLQSPSQLLLTLEEQEKLAETKSRVLERVVTDCIAKKYAQQYGIVTR